MADVEESIAALAVAVKAFRKIIQFPISVQVENTNATEQWNDASAQSQRSS